MNCQSEIAALLPLYVAGTLDPIERRLVDEHLTICPACQAELSLWQDVGEAIDEANAQLPPLSVDVLENIIKNAIERPTSAVPNPIQRAWCLVKSQIPLVRKDIWLPSAIVMAIGLFVALFSGSADRAGFAIQLIAPLVAIAGIAAIYGADNDPGLELALATPTSPRQVLLARLVIVFGYDLCLALLASVCLLLVVPVDLLGSIVLAWLGPMTFLSALALTLSLCIGTTNAIAVAAFLWLARWITGGAISNPRIVMDSGLPLQFAQVYRGFWDNPMLVLALAAALFVIALILVGRQEPFFPKGTA